MWGTHFTPPAHHRGVAHDVPADVQDVLTQLHEAAVEAAATAAGDDDSASGADTDDTPSADTDDTTVVDDADDTPSADTDNTPSADADDTTVVDDAGNPTANDDPSDPTADAPEAFAAPVETAQTVASNKLPAGELRSQFTHGYDRALAIAAAEPAVAAEYVRAVDRRLAAVTDRGRDGVAGDDPDHSTDSDDASDSTDPDNASDSTDSDNPDDANDNL